ncbi:E7 [Mastomys coucha papillomavirus 2]|uniref:Protein E7 n=1 Tax=Mastomys coucha papillomavirus 2 TaxID=392505 RepID=Q06RH4_9PAPI|nr:E7 [Mastomys coucha papillomavirus 2]ABG56158.1 E7 [Mastomys coucha papillomavirus 2]
MLGPVPTLRDIELVDLEVLAAHVPPADQPDVGSSSLSPDSLGEEVELEVDPYRVATTCYSCDTVLRFIVVAGCDSLKLFEELLTEDFDFLCPGCVKDRLLRKRNNGRRK